MPWLYWIARGSQAGMCLIPVHTRPKRDRSSFRFLSPRFKEERTGSSGQSSRPLPNTSRSPE